MGGEGHLPHQLLVVERQGGLPAEDVHLALEDRHLHLPFHPLLGLGDAVADKFTLRAVPETCRRRTQGTREGPLPASARAREDRAAGRHPQHAAAGALVHL